VFTAADGNARLTATTGLVLLVLLPIEGLTLLSLHSFLSLHMLIGVALIPPVALKMGSTFYRFFRYYTGSAIFREKGPPQLVMRILVAPALVASTIALFGAASHSSSSSIPTRSSSRSIRAASSSGSARSASTCSRTCDTFLGPRSPTGCEQGRRPSAGGCAGDSWPRHCWRAAEPL